MPSPMHRVCVEGVDTTPALSLFYQRVFQLPFHIRRVDGRFPATGVRQDPFAGPVWLWLHPGGWGSSSPRWTGWAGFSEGGNVSAVTPAWPQEVGTCSDPELFCLLPVPCPLPPPACAAILTQGVKLLQRCWVLLGAVAAVFWLDLSHP